ncbi:MAG: NUDIX domain-containing protein [Clostridia bacterium]|nr:NUDIX domain-containing protein [Clostridia bacterium]
MKTLHVFDDRDYDETHPHFCRAAVRAVIFSGGRLAMVKSCKEGFYKFPGGGIEPGESRLDTLTRETREETGLCIRPGTAQELGLVRELRKGLCGAEVFDQTSYYYTAEAEQARAPQALDAYEAELDYRLAFVTPRAAYEANTRLASRPEFSFLRREAYVLSLLCEKEEGALCEPRA